MNTSLKGKARPQSAQAQVKARLNAIYEEERRDLEQRVAELTEKVDRKNLAQKLFEAGDGWQDDPYELIYSALQRAEGMAQLLGDVFMAMDGSRVHLKPSCVAHFAEALERDIREALLILKDYQEKGGFRKASKGDRT